MAERIQLIDYTDEIIEEETDDNFEIKHKFYIFENTIGRSFIIFAGEWTWGNKADRYLVNDFEHFRKYFNETYEYTDFGKLKDDFEEIHFDYIENHEIN